MLQPKKLKYRKLHRGRSASKGKATKGTTLSFGAFGLKAIEGGEITARQIEAARRVITHAVKRAGKIWIRIFPHKPITRKPAEVPMGSGKGGIEFYVANIKAGTMLFEMDGVSEELAKKALKLAAYKLPMHTKVVTKIN